MVQPRTTPGKLSDVARHVVVPSGIVSTGWPAVRDRCAEFGVVFDPWQDGAGRVILAKRADGAYACSIGGVVMSIPRQVGKTFLIGAVVFALCLLTPGTTVLWTAHRLRTANETFGKMQAFARRKQVKPHVAKVVLGSGDEEIVFHNGSRILFGARERGFGRGFDNVDVEVFDEAQILTENAIDDMVPATNTAANPLLLFVGTPPKPSDQSSVFTAKRMVALNGGDEDGAYIEFSADRDCDPEDRAQWVKANPSYPVRTPDAAMLRMKKNLSAESFVREGLGVWDAPAISRLFAPGVWERVCHSGVAQPKHGLVLAFDVNAEQTSSSIAVASAGGVGGLVDRRPGVGWAVDEVIRVAKDRGAKVALSSAGPAGAHVAELERAGVEVVPVGPADYRSACGWFRTQVDEDRLTIERHDALDAAVRAASVRASGDGFVWDRRTGDITALVALTLATYVAAGLNAQPAVFGPSVSVPQDNDLFRPTERLKL